MWTKKTESLNGKHLSEEGEVIVYVDLSSIMSQTSNPTASLRPAWKRRKFSPPDGTLINEMFSAKCLQYEIALERARFKFFLQSFDFQMSE